MNLLTIIYKYDIIIIEEEVISMYSSRFVKRKQKTTHEYWCDIMVTKAQCQRVYSTVCVIKRPIKVEPTYTNYELKKIFENYLTK